MECYSHSPICQCKPLYLKGFPIVIYSVFWLSLFSFSSSACCAFLWHTHWSRDLPFGVCHFSKPEHISKHLAIVKSTQISSTVPILVLTWQNPQKLEVTIQRLYCLPAPPVLLLFASSCHVSFRGCLKCCTFAPAESRNSVHELFLPETNILGSTWTSAILKRKLVFQPSICRCYVMLVSGKIPSLKLT